MVQGSLQAVCQSALEPPFYGAREHRLAIFQAPGGDSKALGLNHLQGLARGNLKSQIPKGMGGH